MSIGNLKTEGNKGNNFPWQLKMLLGQQCACDQLTELVGNTNEVETLLTDILASLQASTEYEAKFVVDTCNGDVVYLEVRVWDTDTSTWGPITYYLPGSDTAVIPTGASTPGCLQYADPNAVLTLILTAIQSQTAILIDIEAITSQMTFTADDLNVSANMQVSDVDVSAANPVPVVLPVGSETPNYVEYLGPTPPSSTPGGAKSVSLFNEGPSRWELSSDGGTTWVNFNEGQIVEWTASEGKTLNGILFRKIDIGGRLIMSYSI
jgi:hypothetical protein